MEQETCQSTFKYSVILHYSGFIFEDSCVDFHMIVLFQNATIMSNNVSQIKKVINTHYVTYVTIYSWKAGVHVVVVVVWLRCSTNLGIVRCGTALAVKSVCLNVERCAPLRCC